MALDPGSADTLAKWWKAARPKKRVKPAPGQDSGAPSNDEDTNKARSKFALLHPDYARRQKAFIAESQVLSLSNDTQLATWFKENRLELQGLADQALREQDIGQIKHRNNTLDPPVAINTVETKLEKLKLGEATRLRKTDIYLTCVPARYSGVGLLYSLDDKPPLINPYGCIWIEKLANNWYIMRLADEHQKDILRPIFEN